MILRKSIIICIVTLLLLKNTVSPVTSTRLLDFFLWVHFCLTMPPDFFYARTNKLNSMYLFNILCSPNIGSLFDSFPVLYIWYMLFTDGRLPSRDFYWTVEVWRPFSVHVMNGARIIRTLKATISDVLLPYSSLGQKVNSRHQSNWYQW